MKLKLFLKAARLLAVLFVLTLSGCAAAPAQSVYQTSSTPKYVKTTEDTVSAIGNASVRRTVLITAQTVSGTANKDLVIYLSNSAGTKDVNTYFKVPNGKALRVSFLGNRVYRKAASDSCYSQVIYGDVSLMNNIAENKWTMVYASKEVKVEECSMSYAMAIAVQNFENIQYARRLRR
ncbi:MAG: hypothetical protein K1X86_15450 [Ignavibacteria bacterium]|nr:hypothetical protein [Ignavibacteria bacterium]